MTTDLPYLALAFQIVGHTPHDVWLILATLIGLGALQLREHVVPARRLALAPIGLGIYSLWSTTVTFGTHPGVVAAWAIGSAAAVFAVVSTRRLRWPRQVRSQGPGRFALQGSPWPLILMVSIFALRYALAVSLAFHPAWANVAAFGMAMSMLFGALSGLFAGRSLRILRSADRLGIYAGA